MTTDVRDSEGGGLEVTFTLSDEQVQAILTQQMDYGRRGSTRETVREYLERLFVHLVINPAIDRYRGRYREAFSTKLSALERACTSAQLVTASEELNAVFAKYLEKEAGHGTD